MAYERESKEAVALKSLQSKRYPDSNKDFQKFMTRTNASIDYISSYMQIMQKGIDDANQNPIEQIQSFINDLIVLFAGGEPTGFEFGDLKYIIQGLGALFGLNGPFPISLIDAASHFFLGYVVPLPQFTDVIFDSIFAWAEELGLSEDFINTLQEFREALEGFVEEFGDLFDALGGLFGVFGTDFGSLGGIWDIVATIFDGLNAAALRPILQVMETWTTPFIEALTIIVNALEPLVDELTDLLEAIGGASGPVGQLWATLDALFSSLSEDAIAPILSLFTSLTLPIVEALVNIAEVLSPFTDVLVQIATALGPIIEGLADLVAMFSDGLGNLNIGSFIENFLLPNGILDLTSPLNAGNLFGKLLPNLFSKVPYTTLTGEKSNLLVAANFPNLASIYDNPVFTFDPSQTRTADGTGSAKRICNGQQKALRGIPIPVTLAQEFEPEVWVKVDGLTYTAGQPVAHLDVVLCSGDPNGDQEDLVDVETVRIASLIPASGTQTWTKISGALDPEEITEEVTCLRVRLVVAANATAGTIRFDDALITLNNQIQMGWVGGLLEEFLGIFGVFGGTDLTALTGFITKFLSLLNLGDIEAFFSNPVSAIWTLIADGRINPLGIFANLVGGLLPNSQKPQWLADLTDGVGNLFFGSSNSGLNISNALESLLGIWGDAGAAQGSADDANIGVQILNARLDAPGTVGFDEFDYTSANTLPSGTYALLSSGPGGGNYGPNGKGQLVWEPSGSSQRLKIYKRTDLPIGTDCGVVTAVWSTKIKDPLFSDGFGYICGRMYNADNNTRIQAAIDNNTARIQAVVSGSVTNIGSSVSVDTRNGDVWELWYGIPTNLYKFWLKQNGNTVLRVEDTGHVSQVGANYRMCGFGGQADNYSLIFQIAPPTLNGWTWKDHNATAVP